MKEYMGQIVQPPFWRYYLALTFASWILDFLIRPWVGYVSYEDFWYVFEYPINNTPLLVLFEYPVAVFFWVCIVRLLQRIGQWSWRTAFYTGIIPLSISHEVISKFIVPLWHYPDWVLWTDNFFINLFPIVLIGWLPYWILADGIAGIIGRIEKTRSS